MTVLLIRPMTPSSSHSGMVSVQYPINLGYLASYLKEKNIPCIVKDFEVETYTSEAFVSFIKAARIKKRYEITTFRNPKFLMTI